MNARKGDLMNIPSYIQNMECSVTANKHWSFETPPEPIAEKDIIENVVS